MVSILIVDDERAARFGMKKALSREYSITEAENGQEAWERLQDGLKPDLVFLDLNMPKMNGMELLTKIQGLPCPPMVIVVTAHGSEKIAVEAMKNGAHDYIAKPYEVDELRLTAQHALERVALTRENERLLEEIRLRESFGEIIGESQVMLNVYDLIEKIAQTDITVLICGESGTGKELVAREIHKRSKRANKTFVAINCAALPENLIESELFGHEKGAFTGAGEQRKGKLEETQGGTLFLDEIGDMTINTQAKLLRVLQERTFERLGGNKTIQADVRFITATNKNLTREIENSNFREDLYYRIKVLDIVLPPLRERITDIPCLAKRFFQLFSRKYQKNMQEITSEAIQKMMAYHWPGNVRQLKNVIEKGVVLATGSNFTTENLPPEILQENTTEKPLNGLKCVLVNTDNISFKEAKRTYVQEFEKQFIVQKLKMNNGNISRTAQGLEMPRQSLQQKLKELGINARDFIDD